LVLPLNFEAPFTDSGSIENIHKVIDPLFLNDLKEELEAIKGIQVPGTQKKRLKEYQKKLSGLVFFDPACGSGNFLTETYISLRRIENEVLRLISAADSKTMTGQITFGFEEDSPIQVSIHQFYGIEINDFAVAVAQTALWIAESQAMKETEDIVHQSLDFFPLKTYKGITEGNALRIDWSKAVPVNNVSYIMGNPPFRGARFMSAEQKSDIAIVFPGWKNVGNLDYVGCWYKKTFDMIKETTARAALVSTNSISQGDAVAILWKPLFEQGVHIDFAHRTFVWDSEASDKASVHCVVIGFSTAPSNKKKVIYTDGQAQTVSNINAYLLDAPNVFIENRKHPLCNAPEIGIGNKPIDGGHYLFEETEMQEFINKEPGAAKYFHPWYGAREFINRSPRYCLYLANCSPSELRKLPECLNVKFPNLGTNFKPIAFVWD